MDLNLLEKEQTNELCIMYGVEQKKPLSELSAEEILPSEITIGDQVLRTDVYEISRAELLACNPVCGTANGPNAVINKAVTRPLMGGLSITSTNNVLFVGTMGFIAVHTTTNSLVGVTNNHVVIQDAFIACDRAPCLPEENEYLPIDNVYQNGELGVIPPPNFTIWKNIIL